MASSTRPKRSPPFEVREAVQILLKLDSCTISDALERLGVMGAVIGIGLLARPGKRIAGPVITVELVEKGTATPLWHLGARAIDAASPMDIIVVANAGRTHVSGWGGVLSNAAKSRGVAGVVVDGAYRDVDESVRLGFNVFARAAVPVTARGRVMEKSFNQPVQIGGLTVNHGDFVIADSSGVVFIPRAKFQETLVIAREMTNNEARMIKAILAGKSVAAVMDSKYENLPKSENAL
jgi:4-hydroxy-4-methyl-2-oxoglutarate aldolase